MCSAHTTAITLIQRVKGGFLAGFSVGITLLFAIAILLLVVPESPTRIEVLPYVWYGLLGAVVASAIVGTGIGIDRVVSLIESLWAVDQPLGFNAFTALWFGIICLIAASGYFLAKFL